MLGCSQTRGPVPVGGQVPVRPAAAGEAAKLTPGLTALGDQNRVLAERAASMGRTLQEARRTTTEALRQIEALEGEAARRPITAAELSALRKEMNESWLRAQWLEEEELPALTRTIGAQAGTILGLEATVGDLRAALAQKDEEVAALRRADADHRAARAEQEAVIGEQAKQVAEWRSKYDAAKPYKHWAVGLGCVAVLLGVLAVAAEYARRRLGLRG